MDYSKLINPLKPNDVLRPRKKRPNCNTCGRKSDLHFEALLTDLNTMKPIRQINFVCYECFHDAETAFSMGKKFRSLGR